MLEVCVLGPIAVRVDGELVEIVSRAQRAVLAALARRPRQVVGVDRLADLIWGDDPPPRAVTSLRSHVSRLRAAMTVDVIAADRGGYVLTVDPDRVDAHRVGHRIERAGAVEDLDDALAEWRGDAFGEFANHPLFVADSARLGELRTNARVQRAAMCVDAGRPGDALADLQAIVAADPLREPAVLLLLQALHRCGRQAEAVAVAGRYRRRLAAEGLEPSQAFVVVEAAIFRPAHPAPPRRLPERPGEIVGRDDELDRLRALLAGRRAVTLVGPGGVGKTTLAIEAAHVADVDDAWVVPLTEVDADGSVLAAVARATGAPTIQPLERSVRAHLVDRTGLLVLDNAEHVLHEAARTVELLASDDLSVLTTSRQPLSVDGEVVVDVEPLDETDAVALFKARAADAGHPFIDEGALIAQLCASVDRLPLAIEMAAARLRSLPLQTLASRLDDRMRLLRRDNARDERHRTLSAVVDWSYQLLDADQRELLAQLSVFVGRFTLDAAEAVCAAPAAVDVTLADLVERSLVQFDPVTEQYRLLDTIRQFAAERRGDGHDAIIRHITYHVRRAERIGRGLAAGDDTAWAATFDVHAADIEAAHRRARLRGDADPVARMSAAVYPLVYQRMRADVSAWAGEGLELVRAASHPLEPAVRAVVALDLINRGDLRAASDLLSDLPDHPAARHAYEVRGDLHLYQGALDDAIDDMSRAEILARAADDRATAALSFASRAIAYGYAGKHSEARTMIERGTRVAGTPLMRAWLDYATAELQAEDEPLQTAAVLDGVVEQATDAGWAFLLGVALVTAGSVRARHADPQDALRAFGRLIRHWRRAGDVTHQWTTLRNLVELLVRVGADEPAARLLGAVSATSAPTYGTEARHLDAAARQLRQALGDERFTDLTLQGSGLELGAVEDLALAAIGACS